MMTPEFPKISVVTVCLNAPMLSRTCESIAGQDYENIEWLVIDGGSGPETQQIFDSYKNQMAYFVSERDTGIYNAMNKGLVKSTGDYVIFMNGGDAFVEKTTVSDAARVIRDQESHGAPGSPREQSSRGVGCADVYYGDIILGNLARMNYPAAEHLSDMYFCCQGLPHQAQFFRTSVLMPDNLYDENLSVCSDYRTTVKLYQSGAKFHKLDMVVALYDNHGRSSQSFNLTWTKERLAVLKECFHKPKPLIFGAAMICLSSIMPQRLRDFAKIKGKSAFCAKR